MISSVLLCVQYTSQPILSDPGILSGVSITISPFFYVFLTTIFCVSVSVKYDPKGPSARSQGLEGPLDSQIHTHFSFIGSSFKDARGGGSFWKLCVARCRLSNIGLNKPTNSRAKTREECNFKIIIDMKISIQ